MANELQEVYRQIADLKHRSKGTSYQGTVAEVKGDKIRVDWGAGPKNLSPWLSTSDHRGGSRERKFYKKGQNVTIGTVNGRMDESATISADSPNKNMKAPDHADGSGEESETYQLGELHKTNNKDTYDYFLAPEQQQGGQQQGGGGGGGQQGQQGGGGGGKAEMKQRMNKSGGLTGRVGDGDSAARYAAHKEGVKLRFGDDFLYINKEGIFSSKPIQVSPKDPIPNDND